MWCVKRVAKNPETGASVNVLCSTSEYDDSLFRTMFFEYFNQMPNFNTFTLIANIFNPKEFSDGLYHQEED